jgi:hypothetical protein
MAAAIWFFAIVLLVVAFRKVRRTHGRLGVGQAGVGAIYDMLNEDKQHAVEIIVEEKAEARDPEDKDGNLPDLAGSRRKSRIPKP